MISHANELSQNIVSDVKSGNIKEILNDQLIKKLFQDLDIEPNDLAKTLKNNKKTNDQIDESGDESSEQEEKSGKKFEPKFTEEQMELIDKMVAKHVEAALKDKNTIWQKIKKAVLYKIIKYSIIAALVYSAYKYVDSSSSQDPEAKAAAIQQCIDNYPDNPTIKDKIESFHQGASGVINGAANPEKTVKIEVDKAKDQGSFKKKNSAFGDFIEGSKSAAKIMAKGTKKILSGQAKQEYESRPGADEK